MTDRGPGRSKWEQAPESEFNTEIARMLEAPVTTAVHNDSWYRRLEFAIVIAERRHWFKQAERLTALRNAIGIARGVRRL